jgi:hypothetical protein
MSAECHRKPTDSGSPARQRRNNPPPLVACLYAHFSTVLATGRGLTYMSIREEINARLAEERLFRLKPLNEKDLQRRTVVMSQDINQLVSGPWLDGPMGARCARLRGNLEALVMAENITVCWDPFTARNEQIGRLDDVRDEVWDLRSQEPQPGLRVFFRFAEKNIFVALTCAPRSVHVSWLRRLPLLDRTSREWRDAIVECRSEWRKLFPAHEPISGSSIDDYLTGAVL